MHVNVKFLHFSLLFSQIGKEKEWLWHSPLEPPALGNGPALLFFCTPPRLGKPALCQTFTAFASFDVIPTSKHSWIIINLYDWNVILYATKATGLIWVVFSICLFVCFPGFHIWKLSKSIFLQSLPGLSGVGEDPQAPLCRQSVCPAVCATPSTIWTLPPLPRGVFHSFEFPVCPSLPHVSVRATLSVCQCQHI